MKDFINFLLNNDLLFLIIFFTFVLIFVFLFLNTIIIFIKINKIFKNISKINNLITAVVSPHFLDVSIDTENLLDLAFNIWKIENKFNNIKNILSETQKDSINNILKNLKKYIEKYNVKIIDFTNEVFTDDMNVDVISIEKDKNIKKPIILETLEPTITIDNKIVRRAKVIILTN